MTGVQTCALPICVALDAVDAPTLLVDHSATLRAVEQQWPKIRFHALREHAGLVFQSKM